MEYEFREVIKEQQDKKVDAIQLLENELTKNNYTADDIRGILFYMEYCKAFHITHMQAMSILTDDAVSRPFGGITIEKLLMALLISFNIKNIDIIKIGKNDFKILYWFDATHYAEIKCEVKSSELKSCSAKSQGTNEHTFKCIIKKTHPTRDIENYIKFSYPVEHAHLCFTLFFNSICDINPSYTQNIKDDAKIEDLDFRKKILIKDKSIIRSLCHDINLDYNNLDDETILENFLTIGYMANTNNIKDDNYPKFIKQKNEISFFPSQTDPFQLITEENVIKMVSEIAVQLKPKKGIRGTIK